MRRVDRIACGHRRAHPKTVIGPFQVYELIIESEFSAAHRLREYRGACEQLPGQAAKTLDWDGTLTLDPWSYRGAVGLRFRWLPD